MGLGGLSASGAVWDFEGMLAISMRQVELVRDAGALSELPVHLSALGLVTTWMGDFASSASLIAEAESVAAATGSYFHPSSREAPGAPRARSRASALIATALEQAAAKARHRTIQSHWAAAVLYNGLARYPEAASAARQATSNAFEPYMSEWALAELVEAAARGGDVGIAWDAVERLAESTQLCRTDFALGIEARCRALLSMGEAAESLYQKAIERLGRTRLRPELLARTCSTASGCVARIVGSTPVCSCALLTINSRPSGWKGLTSARAES